MSNQREGVQLKDNESASHLLFRIIRDCCAQHPDALASVSMSGSAKVFRSDYINVLPRFEAARLASPARAKIAFDLADSLSAALVFNAGANTTGLSQYLDEHFEPLPTVQIGATSTPNWLPRFVDRGDQYSDLRKLGDALSQRHAISASACRALHWLSDTFAEGAPIDLGGRKIAVLGANAEMAPTELLLRAGADILWLDVAPPPKCLQASSSRAGTLHWVEMGADMLLQPGAVKATIVQFADNQPVDLCLYAYAPGQARELRLTGVMNAIVNALPRDIISSVTALISPTTATPLDAQDIENLEQRRSGRPRWEAILDSLGLLGSGGGCETAGSYGASRTLVGIQGASYQAAQYLGKLMMAETWALHGQIGCDQPNPIRVSANTAAITQTRSLTHPVFDAAFGGAAALQVETLTPEQSQCLNGLLSVADWLHPDMPVPGSVRVHGGIHTLPYPLNTALRIAAAIGFARSPKLLAGLLKRS